MALYWLFEVNKFGKFELFEVNKGCPNVPNISFGFCKALADLIGGGAHKSAALQRQKEPAMNVSSPAVMLAVRQGAM